MFSRISKSQIATSDLRRNLVFGSEKCDQRCVYIRSNMMDL
jgi:hypothetical protein